jgi:hypothetical protein
MVQFQSDETAGDRSHYRLGQPVAVLYAADNPQRARMDTWQSRWGRDAVVPALGLLILIMAWIGQVQAQRRARRRDAARGVGADGAVHRDAGQKRITAGRSRSVQRGG